MGKQSDIRDNRVKIPIKKRPIKGSIIYLLTVIIISVIIGIAFYNYIYKSPIAFLSIPIVIIAGILVNIKAIVNIIDFIFNLYIVRTVVCTEVKYKYDKSNNISDKYSEVCFKDFRNNKVLKYKFGYRVKFTEGTAYRITHGKLSNTYVSVFK